MTHIPDEWVQSAVEAFLECLRSQGIDTDADWTEEVRSALEAVAPLIAAQALRHEADTAPGAWEVPAGVYHLDRTSRNYLRARAEQIEGGTTDADLEASLEWLESVAREREAGQ